MKVAIVSCGLLDTILPLAKHLSDHVALDIYMPVYGERFRESIGDFDLTGLELGMADEETTESIMGPQVLQYLRAGNRKVNVRFFKYPSLKVFNRKNFQLHRQLARELNNRNYELVHLNGYRGSQMFLYGFLKRSVAKVWTVHDPILHSGEDKWQTRLGYHIYRFLGAHYILHNQQQLPEFVKVYGIRKERCHFIPFGPLDIFRIFKNGQTVKQEPKTILFWGRISPYKGIEYLVKASKKAKEEIPGLKVIVAGKPNYPLDTTELEENSVFEFRNGFVENPELVKLLERSSLVVCPYNDATQSGVLMTAYAFDKPVLATAVGGIPEVVEDGVTGKLIPPKNEEALANAMIELMRKPEELEAMSRNVKKMSTEGRLSWKKIASETLRVYQQAIQEKIKS